MLFVDCRINLPAVISGSIIWKKGSSIATLVAPEARFVKMIIRIPRRSVPSSPKGHLDATDKPFALNIA
jgi:hypothetical protein